MSTPRDKQSADAFVALARELSAQPSATEAMQRIAFAAVPIVDGASCAGITVRKNDHFKTVAATSDLPGAVEALEYEFGGPCMDAILHESVIHVAELRTETRWADFVAAARGFEVLSVLSYRLYLNREEPMGALNLYASEAHAFDASAVHTGELFAAHAAFALAVVAEHEKVTNLRVALESNRDIGVAIGILMTRYLVTREAAFDLLRSASQHAHRKLRDIAAEVTETGALTSRAPVELPTPLTSNTVPRTRHSPRAGTRSVGGHGL